MHMAVNNMLFLKTLNTLYLMQKYILFLGILASCSSQDKWESQNNKNTNTLKLSEYEEIVSRYQDSMSIEFMSGSNGVLKEKDISQIGRLNYFEPNKAYKVAARFTKINGGKIFQMSTSTDRLQEYKLFGKLHFVIKGDSLKLTLYQSI